MLPTTPLSLVGGDGAGGGGGGESGYVGNEFLSCRFYWRAISIDPQPLSCKRLASARQALIL